MKRRALYILFVAVLLSCTNNEIEVKNQTNILEPVHGSFLPLYPNSLWIYENEFGGLDTFYTEGYKNVSMSCVVPPIEFTDSITTTTLFREPALTNLRNVNGYNTYTCTYASLNQGNYQFPIVLSKDVGDLWYIHHYDPRYYLADQAKIVESVDDEYLLLSEFETGIQFGAIVNDTIIYKETYQRDIGLIERLRINNYTNDTIRELKLVDFKINR